MMWFLLFILLILIGVLIWFHRKSDQEWERELAYLIRHEQDGKNQPNADLLMAEVGYRQVSVSPMLSNAREVAKSKQKAIETRVMAEQLKENSLPTPRRRTQQGASDELLPMFDGDEQGEQHDNEPMGEGDDFMRIETAEGLSHSAGVNTVTGDGAQSAHTMHLDHIPQAPSKPIEVITLETATQLAAKVAMVKKKSTLIVAEKPRETIRLVTQKQEEHLALVTPGQQAYQATEPTQAKVYTVSTQQDELPVIGIDDIRVNLLKQRETRRRQTVDVSVAQQLVLPIIEAEEAFANLAHAKVPYSRGSTVVKQMVTRSSVIPSSARVIGPHAVAQNPQLPLGEPSGPISSRFTPFEHAPYAAPVPAKTVAAGGAAAVAKPLASLLQSKDEDGVAEPAVASSNVAVAMPTPTGGSSVIAGNDLVIDAPAWRIEDRLIAESVEPLIIVQAPIVAEPEPDLFGASEPILAEADVNQHEVETKPKPVLSASSSALKESTTLSFARLDEVANVGVPDFEPEPEWGSEPISVRPPPVHDFMAAVALADAADEALVEAPLEAEVEAVAVSQAALVAGAAVASELVEPEAGDEVGSVADGDTGYIGAELADAPWVDDVPVVDVTPEPTASFAEGDEDAEDYVDDAQPMAIETEAESASWAPKREVVIQPYAPKWAFPLPDLSLLNGMPDDLTPVSEDYLLESGIVIEEKLAEFRVKVKVVESYAGPVVTRHEIEPEAGVRGSQVVNLEKDLARALGFAAIRVVETIPGKTCMGLELPNPKRKTIRLAEIFSSPAFQESSSKLTLALGQDITGEPIVTNLAKAPHLLVAGTTGSGKSVGVNAMILSLLFKATPEEVRLIMIDPKMLELSIYEGIPHLLAPVVTDMRLAANALTWCVNEMEKRYRLMSHMGVRNLAGFNAKVKEANARGQSLADPFSLTPETPNPLEPLPFIVVVVDEFADLMMTAGKKIEELIARLAQKARAAGIHLILATQRPSVDVITGLIKANIPTRIAFQVSSKVDSRTILDQMGAESLLGMGDMLFLPPGTAYPQRIHGAFVADEEVHHVVEYLKQFGEPQYVEDILSAGVEEGDLFSNGNGRSNSGDEDPLYDEAVALVIRTQRASISSVQRQLRIGYNRAARLVEQMEQDGVVSAPENNGNRSVMVVGQVEAED